MILLPVDEAYAYDYLAILYVKQEHGLPVGGELWELRRHLMAQEENGHVPVLLVESSPEFERMLEANRTVYDLVEEACQDKCKASKVQKANRERYLAKVALQRRFWPDTPLSESKTQ